MNRIVTVPSIAVAVILAATAELCAAAGEKATGEKAWSYSGGNGPAKWSTLEKGYTVCKTGEQQSPIDIADAKVRKGDIASMLFNYKSSALRIIDNGHSIQVNYDPGSYTARHLKPVLERHAAKIGARAALEAGRSGRNRKPPTDLLG